MLQEWDGPAYHLTLTLYLGLRVRWLYGMALNGTIFFGDGH